MTSTCKLEMALSDAVVGVFTVDGSALDGTDGLADLALSDGTYTDISGDASDPYQVVFGTDNLMSQVQAANLTVRVGRVDDPGYWNPNNPNSPLAGSSPGLTAMRPIRLTETVNGTPYPIFAGYTSRGTWDSTSMSCLLYCEDLLLWAGRVYPTIASTGPTNMGAVFKLLCAQVDPTLVPIADRGIDLPDFSADGSISVLTIFSNLLAADLGTIFVLRTGTPVYRQADYALAQPATATITITQQASEEQSGFDVANIGTRVTVNGVQAINSAAELRSGRGDLPDITSAYVTNNAGLAQEVVLRGGTGKVPVSFTLADVDDATLVLILTSLPLSVYTVHDPYGGTAGDVIVQRLSHTIQTGLHECAFTCLARPAKAMTVDGSALDGPDGLRYP